MRGNERNGRERGVLSESLEREDQEWERFVRGLVEGDQRAYHDFWDQYGRRLSAVAKSR